jgi:hypothetical protein
MFQTIGEMSPEAGHRDLRTFTVCVGRRETPADFYTSEVKVSECKGRDCEGLKGMEQKLAPSYILSIRSSRTPPILSSSFLSPPLQYPVPASTISTANSTRLIHVPLTHFSTLLFVSLCSSSLSYLLIPLSTPLLSSPFFFPSLQDIEAVLTRLAASPTTTSPSNTDPDPRFQRGLIADHPQT